MKNGGFKWEGGRTAGTIARETPEADVLRLDIYRKGKAAWFNLTYSGGCSSVIIRLSLGYNMHHSIPKNLNQIQD
jgi:hypothetical protein